MALLLGVRAAADHGVTRLRVEGDSTLIVQQVRGIFAAHSTRLRVLRNHVKAELARAESFSLHHIDRQANAHADRLANRGLDLRRTVLECGVHADGAGCTDTAIEARSPLSSTMSAPPTSAARPDRDDSDDALDDAPLLVEFVEQVESVEIVTLEISMMEKYTRRCGLDLALFRSAAHAFACASSPTKSKNGSERGSPPRSQMRPTGSRRRATSRPSRTSCTTLCSRTLKRSDALGHHNISPRDSGDRGRSQKSSGHTRTSHGGRSIRDRAAAAVDVAVDAQVRPSDGDDRGHRA